MTMTLQNNNKILHYTSVFVPIAKLARVRDTLCTTILSSSSLLAEPHHIYRGIVLCFSLTQKSKLRHILCLLSSCLSPQNNNNIKSGLMQQTACDASAIYSIYDTILEMQIYI